MRYLVHGNPTTEESPPDTEQVVKPKNRPHDSGRDRGEAREQYRPIR